MNIRFLLLHGHAVLARTPRHAALALVASTVLAILAWAPVVGADTLSLGDLEVDATRILAQYKEPLVMEATHDALAWRGSRIHRHYSLVPGLVALEETNALGKAAIKATATQGQRN